MRMKKCGSFLMAIFLCAAMLLTACGKSSGSGGGAEQKGKFVQQDSTPAEMADVVVDHIRQMPDGRIIALGAGAEGGTPKACATTDGTTWEAAFPFGDSSLFARFPSHFQSYTVDNNGIWWVVFSTREGDDNHLFYVDNGQAAEVTISAFQSEVVGAVTKIQVDSTNTLAVTCPSENGAASIFVDCNSFTELGLVEQAGFDFVDGRLYAFGTNDSSIITYTPNGTQENKNTLPLEREALYTIIGGVCPDDILYYTDGNGLYKVALGGTYVETLADSNAHAYADTSFARKQLLMAKDGSYWLLGSIGMKSDRIYRYVFDENAPTVAANTLTIWAMDENPLLRFAVSVFSLDNPDCDIIVEYGRKGDAVTQTDNDIIRALNTRLLAGDSPDVLILDGLPIYSMIQQGILSDLSDIIDENKYYSNILSSYSENGKTYACPTTFWAPVMAQKTGASPDISSFNSLEDLRQVMQPSQITYGGYYHLFDTMYIAASPDIFPRDASINQDALRSFLSLTKDIVDAQGLASQEYDTFFGVDYEYHDAANTSALFDGGNPSFGYFVNEYKGNTSHMAATLSGYESLLLTNTVEKIVPLAGNSFLPIGIAGIPEDAPNKDLSKQFVKTMLDCQTVENRALVNFSGFSVCRGVDKAFFADMPESYQKDLGIDVNRDDLDIVLGQLSRPSSIDFSLRQKVYAQAKLLYGGSLSLDEAVEAIVKSTELYFAERQ